MAMPSLNSDLIEKVPLNDTGVLNETNENDSGIFSDTTYSQLPVCLIRHGTNANKTGRNYAMSHPNASRRLISKNGKANVLRTRIPYLWTAYIRDIGNTLVNSRWRWTILCFASSYLLSWLLFAWFYMLIARDNDDLSETHPSSTPCLMGISGFAGYFLFSLETQHTIGYGSRFITSNCPEGTFLISLQMIMGVAICGGMASIVYTKMVRPHAPHSKTLFSKTAVICQRNGVLCLIFRVRDEDSRHRVGTKINAYLVQSRAQEPFLKTLILERPGFLLWPLEIVHKITPSSPFWDLSAKDLVTRRLELIVTLQGTSVTTGQCSKTRTSYLTSEILWGHRFKPCVKFDNEMNIYYVDNTDFNTTEEVLTPLCSAQRLHEVIQEITSSIYTPILVKSPTTSHSWRLPNEDEVSMEDSSGIGSMREELLSPVNSVLRKLSTIREFNSMENLKLGSREKGPQPLPPLEVNASIVTVEEEVSSSRSSNTNLTTLNTQVDKYLEDIEGQFPKPDNSRLRNSGAFDVEGLVASLQNYLQESERLKRTSGREFCETNL